MNFPKTFVVDLLSSDAVKVMPGQAVIIEEWGGEGALAGRVRRVEPFGFTKVSALGIEEQRVNVIIDFDSPQEQWARLGHGYQVEVKIVIWEGSDVGGCDTCEVLDHARSKRVGTRCPTRLTHRPALGEAEAP